MAPPEHGPAYRIVGLPYHSRCLESNPLGDPSDRTVWVLLPDGIPDDQPLPEIWMLAAYGASGASFLGFPGFGENLPERVSRLSQAGVLSPCRLVLPDCFTAYGGSQYVNSSAIGRYRDYVVEELVPFVSAQFVGCARGVAGKSSGGYGALTLSMARPDVFHAVACHSGDMGFEWCYGPDLPKFLTVIEETGGIAGFLDRFRRASKIPSSWFTAINVLAMAAAYSPDPGVDPIGVAFPVTFDTAEWVPAIWQRWLDHDPVRMVESPPVQQALRSLRGIYLDAGSHDEYHLQWGLRRFSRRLEALRIDHRAETFPDGHRDTAYRYDVSLPWLSRVLAST